MSGVRVGADLQTVAPVADAVRSHGRRYLDRLFTPHEVAASGLPAASPEQAAPSLAARFAAKEATMKALRTETGLAWTDIEVRRQPGGWCSLELTGDAARLAATSGLGSWSLSLSHDGGYAMACVVAVEGDPVRDTPSDSGDERDGASAPAE